MIDVLIGGGANLDSTDGDGWNALMLASYNGNTEAMNRLIKAGADLTHKTPKGETALSVADHSYIPEAGEPAEGPATRMLKAI